MNKPYLINNLLYTLWFIDLYSKYILAACETQFTSSCLFAYRDFETMACETLRRTYALKPEQAIQLLSVKMSKWGNMSCPILALKFGARRFLSESACLKFTYNTWTRGKPLETLRGVRLEIQHMLSSSSCLISD